MPTATFLHLPEPRRRAVTEAAIDEFAAHPFHEASLSRVVRRAGISKGSIYQYFEDKLDLYRWLLADELPRRKRAALADTAAPVAPSEGAESLAAWLEGLVAAGVRFMHADPRLVALGLRVSQPTADPALRALYRELRREAHAGFAAALRPWIDAGAVRDDLDGELVARVVGLVLGQGLPLLLADLGGVELERWLEGARPDPDAEARLVTRTVSFLLTGLRGRG